MWELLVLHITSTRPTPCTGSVLSLLNPCTCTCQQQGVRRSVLPPKPDITLQHWEGRSSAISRRVLDLAIQAKVPLLGSLGTSSYGRTDASSCRQSDGSKCSGVSRIRLSTTQFYALASIALGCVVACLPVAYISRRRSDSRFRSTAAAPPAVSAKMESSLSSSSDTGEIAASI